jgi:DeoR/GlpR family transcriptional regulator of sugar metabolism
LTIVTNSIMAAAELMESPHRLILLGGEFRAISRTLVGPLTGQIVNSLNINKAFMGTIGFTVESGISTTDPNEAYTKELIMRHAAKVIILADSSKIGVPSFVTSGSLEDIDVLISDANISEKIVEELTEKGIEVKF